MKKFCLVCFFGCYSIFSRQSFIREIFPIWKICILWYLKAFIALQHQLYQKQKILCVDYLPYYYSNSSQDKKFIKNFQIERMAISEFMERRKKNPKIWEIFNKFFINLDYRMMLLNKSGIYQEASYNYAYHYSKRRFLWMLSIWSY